MTDHVAIQRTHDPHRGRRRPGHAWLGGIGVSLIAAVVALYGLSSVAGATTSSKPYSVTDNGSSTGVTVGAGTTTNYSFAITDTATNSTGQTIGSAEIVPPNAFTINGDSISVPAGATATLKNGSSNCPSDQVSPTPTPLTCLIVNNLTITPGSTEVVSFNATASCAAAPADTFGFQVQQSNQFNGKPGNQSGPLTDPAALNVTVSNSCTLQFVATNEPADANPGATISNQSYTPSAGPVEVKALDGSGNPVSGASVTLAIAPTSLDPGKNAQLLWGNVTPVTAPTDNTGSAGIASFGPDAQHALGLNIAQPGEYELQASSPGFPNADSTDFFIGNGEACTGSCSASTSDVKNNQNDNLSTTSAGGDITVIVGLDLPFCSDGQSHAPDVTTTSSKGLVLSQNTFGKELQITFPSKLGPGHFDVCWLPDGAQKPVVLGSCPKLVQPVQTACLISPISKDNTTGLINEDILAPAGDPSKWY